MASKLATLFLLLLSSYTVVGDNKITAEICKKCKCIELNGYDVHQKVDCVKTNLSSFPAASQLPAQILDLDLSMNNLQKVDKLEAMPKLTKLSLATNNISKLENFAFEKATDLALLDLSHNELTEIPETVFGTLEVLQILNLSYNRIEHLPKTLFHKCLSLYELNLEHNPIKFLNAELFAGTPNLEVLNLAHTEIFSMFDGLFEKSKKIKELDLSNNQLQAVPTAPLRMLPNLQKLDLSGNHIRELNEASFYKLSSLRELHLNKIEQLITIGKKTFSSLDHLEKLSIEDNVHLTLIDKYAFVGIFNRTWMAIKEVSFRRNSLSMLSEQTLPFCNLTLLDLRQNPWNCNCHLHWIKYCHGDKQFEKGILCATPEKFRGQELQLIDHSDLKCKDTDHIRHSHILFYTSLVFMFLMFGTLIAFIMRDRITKLYGSKRLRDGNIYYVRAQSEHI